MEKVNENTYLIDLDKREEDECIFCLEEGTTIIKGLLDNDILIDSKSINCDVVLDGLKLDGGSICSFEDINSLDFKNVEVLSEDKKNLFRINANYYVFSEDFNYNNCFIENVSRQGSSQVTNLCDGVNPLKFNYIKILSKEKK